MILLLLIVGICAMSTVSAADNVTDTVASETSDSVTIEQTIADDVISNENSDENEKCH